MPLITDPWFWPLALVAVAITGISKGGMGGGAAVSTPMMAMVISPAQAAAVMLPVLCLMDLAGIKAYLGRWDRRVMRILVPAGLLGSLVGALTFRHMSEHWIRILLGVISLGFLAWSFYPRKSLAAKPSDRSGWFWGSLAGFTSFITHAGSPPVMVWLVPQRLEKDVFVATSLVFFIAMNYAKIIPYFWLGLFDARVLGTSLVLVPLGIAGVYAGVWLQRKISAKSFYRIIYALLLVTGLKLLYEGVSAL